MKSPRRRKLSKSSGGKLVASTFRFVEASAALLKYLSSQRPRKRRNPEGEIIALFIIGGVALVGVRLLATQL